MNYFLRQLLTRKEREHKKQELFKECERLERERKKVMKSEQESRKRHKGDVKELLKCKLKRFSDENWNCELREKILRENYELSERRAQDSRTYALSWYYDRRERALLRELDQLELALLQKHDKRKLAWQSEWDKHERALLWEFDELENKNVTLPKPWSAPVSERLQGSVEDASAY